jgi:hypothetical protein
LALQVLQEVLAMAVLAAQPVSPGMALQLRPMGAAVPFGAQRLHMLEARAELALVAT